MYYAVLFLLFFGSMYASAQPQRTTPQQSLNAYVAFLNQAVDEVTNRFQEVQRYTEALSRYRPDGRALLSLPSSGPLETYYYQKALDTGSGLTPIEAQQVKTSAESLWQTLEKLDQTAKALETYVRLKDYQHDGLKKSNELLKEIQTISNRFSKEHSAFYKEIESIYRQYQPYTQANSYLRMEKEMRQVLVDERKLLQAWPYYMTEGTSSNWPVDLVRQRVVANEIALENFGKGQSAIAYPASSMVSAFKDALRSLQEVKRQAVNEYTFAAQQSAKHGNEVYLSLINHYNNDLLATYHSFVNYSASTRQLLDFPKFCPLFELEPPRKNTSNSSHTTPFDDKPLIAFTIKPSTLLETKAAFQALNGYVSFINESLRQMNRLQLRVRDYQSTAEYYRDPARSQRRNALTYTHAEFEIPTSDYQLLLNASQEIPADYRLSVNRQTEVLMNILKEMDQLGIELVGYTNTKQYEQDGLQRSDEILDRYAYLFETFDQRKEQLYTDIRRIHESYKVSNPTDSWYVASRAMLQALDEDRAILFGLKAYFKGERTSLPGTDITTIARKLIADEYQNLKGLQRYGRSNGLCPYTPYEDLAENSIRFGEKFSNVSATGSRTNTTTAHPYESFYYFYNGELVYQYNKFSELAKLNVLKAVNQPNLFAFRRITPSSSNPVRPGTNPIEVTQPPNRQPNRPTQAPAIDNKPTVAVPSPTTTGSPNKPIMALKPDTVYVERTKTDTVFIDRSGPTEDLYSLKGFAANNMVLLLDASGSMDSPYKMPLLKKSIKSLLKLLRPEDQISIVVYSGKAKIALKTTPGTAAAEIAQAIDRLESDGDTDGNGGIRLAYKVANKSYIRGGNNRIVLATDGEFPISDDTYKLVTENAQQDVFLTVFTFDRKEVNSPTLKKLASLGKGSCDHVTAQNADLRLILEARAKKN